VSEIQSLILRARALGQAVDWWNEKMLGALVVTALAAIAVVVTTHMVLKRAKQLADVQEELLQAKDRQLASDLKDKDVKIADTNKLTAALEVEALTLRKQLLAQGPRGSLLTGENRRKLVDELKPFAKQKIDVRHSASVMMVNSRIVQSTPIGDDTVGLADALVAVLKDAGWDLPSNALPSKLAGQGIIVEIVHKASPDTKVAAKALVAALKKVPLTISELREVTDNLAKRVSEDVIQPEFGENTIVLDVLTHP